jgi:hypothetical protein
VAEPGFGGECQNSGILPEPPHWRLQRPRVKRDIEPGQRRRKQRRECDNRYRPNTRSRALVSERRDAMT